MLGLQRFRVKMKQMAQKKKARHASSQTLPKASTGIQGLDENTYRAFVEKMNEGAVILSQVKGWEGAVAVCGPEFAGWFASPEYRTFRCDPTEARPSYLAALVRTEWFWSRLAQATRGVGARRERTRPEQFVAIEIPVPELEQQRRGEAVFAQLHAAKQLQTETTIELDTLLPSILDRAFNGEL